MPKTVKGECKLFGQGMPCKYGLYKECGAEPCVLKTKVYSEPCQEVVLYELAMKTWGEGAQLLMLVEECNELSKAVCDRLRGRVTIDGPLLDEMADVKIMIGQVECLVDGEELERVRQAKLRRLKERLEKHVGPLDILTDFM